MQAARPQSSVPLPTDHSPPLARYPRFLGFRMSSGVQAGGSSRQNSGRNLVYVPMPGHHIALTFSRCMRICGIFPSAATPSLRMFIRVWSVRGNRVMACRCSGIAGVDLERCASALLPAGLPEAAIATPDRALLPHADEDGDRVRAWLPAADSAGETCPDAFPSDPCLDRVFLCLLPPLLEEVPWAALWASMQAFSSFSMRWDHVWSKKMSHDIALRMDRRTNRPNDCYS
mmetsp:Transcript_18343/g.51975  ORF Transcript_18343/g.51975 Transcript_18343/m.51975 type:complete len:230 (-) Transcript_18343:4-693(-)